MQLLKLKYEFYFDGKSICYCCVMICDKWPGLQGSSVHGASSVLSATSMDHSFVVLPKQKNQAPGVPPRHRPGPLQPEASQSGRAMEESFVVLPPPAASVYKSESATDGVGAHFPTTEDGPTNIPIHPNNCGFHSTITVLRRAFDIATTQSQVMY